jgi:flagellar export protein FliJ
VAAFRFRLQPLLEQKLRRKEEAEREMATRQKYLREEQESLNALHCELENLHQQVVTARRELLTSVPASGLSLMDRSQYLSALELDADAVRDAMFTQELVFEEAEARLDQARQHLANCSREAEILTKYKDKLQQRFLHASARTEEIEQDEIGNMLYLNRSRR